MVLLYGPFAGYIASPCPAGHGLHVHGENVLLEVLDDADHPCQPGQTGHVVLTTLHNFLTPLIRYDIMDEATVGPEPCPCGRGLPLFSSVLGKRRPFIQLPNGLYKFPTALLHGLWKVAGFHQYQVIQRAVDHVVVCQVPDRSWTAEHPGRIKQIVQEFFEAPIRVEVQTEDFLELPAGGKLVDVVSELESGPASPHRTRS